MLGWNFSQTRLQMSFARTLKATTFFFNRLKTLKWTQYLLGNEANPNSIRYSSSTGMYGHIIYLPLHHLECWDQLLVQQGNPIFWYGHFQLPSAKESSDGEKESTEVNKLSFIQEIWCTIHQISWIEVKNESNNKWSVKCICCIQFSCHNILYYLFPSWLCTLEN